MPGSIDQAAAIHKFRVDQKMFVFQVDSLDFFQIDEVVWDALDHMQTCTRDDVMRRLAARHGAEQAATGLNETETLLAGQTVVRGGGEPRNFSPNTMLLQVSHACNLKCGYCFVQQAGYCADKSLMTAEVARQAVRFFSSTAMEQGLRVTFFGGEPLLNPRVIRAIVDATKGEEREHEKRFAFRLSTNGTLLDEETLSFMFRNNFDSIQISLDGPPAIQDRNRPFTSGGGSFDCVVANVRRAMDCRWSSYASSAISLNACFTRHELDIHQTFLFLSGLGPKTIDMSPYFLPESHSAALTIGDLQHLRLEYRKIGALYLEMLALDSGVCFLPYASRMKQLLSRERVSRGCRAGVESFAVAPNGDVYACQILDGRLEHRIGDVFRGVDEGRQAAWACSPVSARSECTTCWIRNFCGGGCRANSVLFGGGMERTYDGQCLWERVLVEEVIGFISDLEDRGLLEHAIECLEQQP